MPMESTAAKSGSPVTFSIRVGATAIPDTFQVYSVTIEKGTNKIPTAKIVVLDGNAESGTFDASSSATFVPGQIVTIEAGYDSKNSQIFKGIITKQMIKIDASMGSILEIECRDQAIKITVGRKTASFGKQKDSDIISMIISSYGITHKVDKTTIVSTEQIQYYVSDWDFILSRAEANGLVINVIDGQINVVKPDSTPTPVLTITYGDNMYGFNAELNAINQLSSVKASTWDYKNQTVLSEQITNSFSGPGNLSSETLSQVVGLNNFQLQTTAPQDSEDLQNWSSAQLLKSVLAKIQGELKFQGSSLVDPGKYITINGVGDRFSGDHFISGIVHSISGGNWITQATIGLSPNWSSEESDIMAPPASGLLPGVQGLFNGTVKSIAQDPESQYRILVDIPLFDHNGDGVWARLTNFYSTNGAGAFFLPEIGDEVVLGFLNEDPRYPIILGSMYSSTKIQPYKDLIPNERNNLKAIVSKSGIALEFDEDKKILTLRTPGKNSITLSDESGAISLEDQNNNSIIMSSSGITIKSDRDITFEAGQNLNLNGKFGISLTSSGNVTTKGTSVSTKATSQFSVSSDASTDIKSNGQLSLKGTLITIN